FVLGTPFPAALYALEPSRVMRVDPKTFHAIAASSPEISAKLGASARDRIEGLEELAAEDAPPQVRVVGHRWDAICHDVRRFLERNQIVFEWQVPDDDADASRLPVLEFPDGTTLVRPGSQALAERLGLTTCPRLGEYDTIIIG